MITTEEMARLRVGLAELPGFDPVGLRVWEEAEAGVVVGRDDRPEGERRGEWLVYPATGEWEGCDTGGCDPVISAGPSHLTIDLADSATRDRVARHVAARARLEIGNTAPQWTCTFRAEGFGRWSITGRHERQRTYHGGHHEWGEAVRELQDIDATDARTLSDGSSYADALALALVACHLGAA